jgi:hypothetical protein
MIYHWLRIRSADRGWQSAHARLLETGLADGVDVWGRFFGLFGIGSNELVLMLHGPRDLPVEPIEAAGFEVVERHALVPTVRPKAFAPLTRPGLYVFRFFDVRNVDVEEIAGLSQEAWTSFEDTDAYAAEPQGLFCQADRSTERGVMLLLTWYDGLESWQTSRQPAPEARENFKRRHQLTLGTIAYATRLLQP